MSSNDNWLGYLVSVFIDETLTQSIECCPGCHDQKNSAVLHSHHHSGLLEKLVLFHPLVRETILSKIKMLVKDYVERFPDATLYDEADQKVLRTFGRDFLMQSTPTVIYYTHYLTSEVDELIHSTPKTHIKPMTLKRAATKMKKLKEQQKKKPKSSKVNEKSAIN